MIKVIFFDIDNTLLSFSGYVKAAMREGFSLYGLKPYTEDMFDVFQKINNSLWKRIEEGTLTFNELLKIRWNMIFEELGINFDGEIFEKYFGDCLFSNAVPEEGANEILEYLSKKYTLCVASNGPFEQQINRLKVGKMYDYFTRFFISSAVGASKPNREFFDCCFNDLKKNGFPNILPEETVIIGDSIASDIVGAKAYGMKTCLYQQKPSADDTKDADFVIYNLLELKQIL